MTVHTSSLQYFIVQRGGLSNKEAIASIMAGRVLVNGKKGLLRQALLPEDTVTVDGRVLKTPQMHTYLAFHKPRGVESTLNPRIADNLLEATNIAQRVFPVGRLDKESEGLMLLTDDGNLYERVTHAAHHQEKEYAVTVDKPITAEMLELLAAGIVIMGKRTRPAFVAPLTQNSFRIILTQGLNRQIRRMCYKLGYQVQQLIRIRMVNIRLGELGPGQWRPLHPEELQELKAIIGA